ncbi:MAG: hypothetical protein J5725_06220 [Bacteroidales bacterium]|nr:hypothetical protein [Bacteroidales bacterium]
MAIQVNVISENNAFAVETANYCTVALPITACWGPCFNLPTSNTGDTTTTTDPVEAALENTAWSLFQAGPEGLESFIATYRGPSSNYRSTKDYSYFMALSLLNAGYTIQTCRLCPGTKASVTLDSDSSSSSTSEPNGSLIITAKYPGTFGNSLKVTLKKKTSGTSVYWNLIGYAVDSNGTTRAVENMVFVFEVEHSTDTIVAIDELQSKFFDFKVVGTITDSDDISTATLKSLEGGSDIASAADQTAEQIMDEAINLATLRYGEGTSDYLVALNQVKSTVSKSTAEAIRFNEWVYTYTTGANASVSSGDTTDGVLDLLRDRINYNPNRIISPWDDQDILAINPDYPITNMNPSPMALALMQVAAISRCATAYIDVPRSLPRSRVWDDTEDNLGYAQRLSSTDMALADPLYPSNSALFAPWGQYTYAGTTKQAPATPSFMALLIERAMIKNQSAQYEWALPNTRNNNVKLGQLAYTVPKALLDNWQASDGTRVNTITTVPSLGTTIWGNATLFDVPVATYQALMNLSTRKLINAVKDTVFKIGIGLEFQYNGQEAYAKFFAGVTPLLDTMRNVGAIEDYKVKMAADINNIDSINANSVVGTIYLVIVGVIENITVDLIALPQGTDLNQY